MGISDQLTIAASNEQKIINGSMRVLMLDSLVGNDYALCLAENLQQQGAEVELVVTANRQIDRSPVRILPWAPSKARSAGKIGKLAGYLRYLFAVWRHCRKQKIDVLHFQFFRRERIETFYFLLLRLLGFRLAYTAHNVLPHENNRIDWLLKRIVYKSASVLIVHSGYIRNKLLENFPVNADKVRIIPHGNFDIYVPQQLPPRDVARSELDIEKPAHVLLFFGYLREYKGLDWLIEAFTEAAVDDPLLELVIAGAPHSKSLADKYAASIAASPASNRIRFDADFVPSEKIATYFQAADYVVLPYKRIDHSGIIHLAYSFSRPVLVTRVGDFPECVLDGETGFLAHSNDVQGIREMISKAFNDPHQAALLGKQARELNDSHFSWQQIANKTLDAYRSLL